jgi:hypothetical protein
MYACVGFVPVLVVECLGLGMCQVHLSSCSNTGEDALTRFMYSHILSPDHSSISQSS